jgi:hypothetical protein
MILRGKLSEVTVSEMKSAALSRPLVSSREIVSQDLTSPIPVNQIQTARFQPNDPASADRPIPGEQSDLININTALLDDLLTIPMINGINANGIIDGRPWSVVEDLIQMQGFGPMKLRRIQPYVTVEPIVETAEEVESVEENSEEPEILDKLIEEEVLRYIAENPPESENSLPD